MQLIIFIIVSVFNFYSYSAEIMKTSELQAGMHGYGLSVFKGTSPERFEVDILGVLHKARNGKDLIIAKLSGCGLEQTGVIAGMSGSPVYISNKLIGAVAFSWGFAKEPIAGITPVEDMFEIFNYSKSTNTLPILKGGWIEKNPQQFKRILTPLIVTGSSEDLLSLLYPELQKMGFEPVLGGESSSSVSSTEKQEFDNLIPGASVAVRLITGDFQLSGIGTVTWRQNDRILIFGHPLFLNGSCNFPVAESEIITVMPGYSSSFKIGSAGRIVGTAIQDRPTGVSCLIGKIPDMIPLSVKVSYGDIQRNFKCEIVDDASHFSFFTAFVISSALLRDKAAFERNALFLKFNIDLGDAGILEWTDLYSNLTAAENVWSSINESTSIIESLIYNPFKSIKIKSIEVSAIQADRIQIADILNLKLMTDKDIFPGDEITLEVSFYEYQGNIKKTNITLKLPEDIPEGNLTLIFSSAQNEDSFGYLISPESTEIKSWDDFLKKLIFERPRNNECSIWGITRQNTLSIKGERFDTIPKSRFKILMNMKEDVQTVLPVKFRERFYLPFVVNGIKKININIKRKVFRSE